MVKRIIYHKANIFMLFCIIYCMAAFPCLSQEINEGIWAPHRLKSILGQDGVTPVPVTDSKGNKVFFWTFGDTFLGSWKGNVNTTSTFDFNNSVNINAMIPNTLAISDVPNDDNYKNLNFQYLLEDKAVTQFIKYDKGENPFVIRYWANDGIQLGNAVYIYSMIVKIDQNIKPFPFKVMGSGLVKWNMDNKWNAKDFNAVKFEKIKGFVADNLIVGDSVIEKDGYVYLLGRAETTANSYASLVFMRVKSENIENFSSYEFLSESGQWADKNMAKFFNDICGEASLSYNETLKKYVVIYMQAAKQQIIMITFKDFSCLPENIEKQIIYVPPAKNGINYYSAKEIFSTKDYIYAIYIDPSIYQPILVKKKLNL